jgi:phage terminase small subunit
MPALDNQRHERFAQELAKGRTATEAYIEAGYKGHDGNAATLRGNQRVAARVAELQDRAAKRTEVTVADITERLLKIAKKGEDSSEAPLLAVARASLMDAAKLNGLVVDRSMQAQSSLEELLDRIDGAGSEPEATTH